MESLNSMSDKWFDAICWSSLLLGIFLIKWFAAFSPIVLGTLRLWYKNKWNIKFSSS